MFIKSRINDHIKSTINHNVNGRYDQMGYFNSSSCLKSHYEAFFENFEYIEVSTDFEKRERRGNNYASLIDEKSNPFVVLNFVKKIHSEIRLTINWMDPNGEN